MIFTFVVAVVSNYKTNSKTLAPRFYLFNLHFLKISRRGDYLYINTAYTQKTKRKKSKKKRAVGIRFQQPVTSESCYDRKEIILL